MVEKKEGAIMDCLNCGTELICGLSKPSDTFKQKLQWQNKNGKAHYKFVNGEYLCIDENGDIIPTKKGELDPKNKKIQENIMEEMALSRGTTSSHTERNLDDSILKSNLAWDYAVEKANRVLPPTNGFNKDNSILSQVFYKGIIELLK